MKKVAILLLVVLMSFAFFSKALAQEGPPIEIVEKFPVQYLELIQNGKLYQGIYMSEEDYTFYTQLKVEFNFVQKQLKTLEIYGEGLEKVIENHELLTNTVLTDLKEVKDLVSHESWWDANKFYIGVGFGAIITGLVIAGVQAL